MEKQTQMGSTDMRALAFLAEEQKEGGPKFSFPRSWPNVQRYHLDKGVSVIMYHYSFVKAEKSQIRTELDDGFLTFRGIGKRVLWLKN